VTASDWAHVKLGEVLALAIDEVSVDPVASYPIAGVYSFGRGLLRRSELEGTDTTYKVFHRLHAGDFVLSQLKAWEGALARVPDSFDGLYVSPQFPTFRAAADRLDTRFLDCYFKQPHTWEELKRGSRGMGARRDSVSPKTFLDTVIPLPPLPEQKRVVARIEDLAARIGEARELKLRADEESESLLDAVIGQRFAELGTREVSPLSHVTSKIGSGSTPAGSAYSETGTPFIRSLNVRMRRFSADRLEFIDEATHARMAGTRVQSGDVLLNITGASIGRVTCFPPSLKEANVSQHVSIIRPDSGLGSRFLMYWLSQPAVQGLIFTTQKGATKQGFTKAQIERLEIPLLSIEEQNEVVVDLDRHASFAEKLIDLQRQRSVELDSLEPSVLAKAFAGGL
jgi:type I restriction enzyme S subunit